MCGMCVCVRASVENSFTYSSCPEQHSADIHTANTHTRAILYVLLEWNRRGLGGRRLLSLLAVLCTDAHVNMCARLMHNSQQQQHANVNKYKSIREHETRPELVLMMLRSNARTTRATWKARTDVTHVPAAKTRTEPVDGRLRTERHTERVRDGRRCRRRRVRSGSRRRLRRRCRLVFTSGREPPVCEHNVCMLYTRAQTERNSRHIFRAAYLCGVRERLLNWCVCVCVRVGGG